MSEANNMIKLCLTFFAVVSISLPFCQAVFPYPYPKLKIAQQNYKTVGDPLIITPFLKNGSISQAQNLSRVSLTEQLGFKSHAGFFTINEQFNSNLYFWYFEPFSKKTSAPVVLWLQGGPGGSSLFGLFIELGPLFVTKKGFSVRKYHWALDYHLIFIDNPVGTGFSFTDNDNGYCTDEDCVGNGLHEAMSQFFQLFPHLKSNEFYITGESYAGKYIPALGMKIHEGNMGAGQKINLQGMAIGNGYCDPEHMMDYGDYLYQHGFIDTKQRKVFMKYQKEIVNAIKNENYVFAGSLLATLFDGDNNNFSYFKNFTGLDNVYNYYDDSDGIDEEVFTKLLNNEKVRRSVHVGNLPFHDSGKVVYHLTNDILKSVAPWVSKLLSHYRILVYNGQLDIIVAYPLTERFLNHLNFSSAHEYRIAKRKIWKVDGEIAGYYKVAGNLTDAMVRDAGHMVPKDQPKWGLQLIRLFIANKFK